MGKTVFTDGDPSLGILGTLVSAAFLNALQNHVHDGKDQDGSAPIEVPFGAEILWPKDMPPTGWLEEDGASLVRATYPDLFAVIGTLYGAADATHFNLPDARGKFPRAWAHGQTTDPDRATRTAPTATGATIVAGDHVGTNQVNELKSHQHPISVTYSATGGASATIYQEGGAISSTKTLNAGSATPAGGNESRPINTYRMIIMKAY